MRAGIVNKIDKRLKEIPSRPGIYLMKDKVGSVLYVGKARNLKKRVSSYLTDRKVLSPKIRALVSKVHNLDYILTQTEKEALILECSLIKRHKPKYNVVLKDDKNYLCLKLDLREEYPVLSIVRRIGKDGSLYFGPYSSAKAVRQTLKLIHEIFPIRQCKDRNFRLRSRPCLLYQMNRCLAPCCFSLDAKEYREIVDHLILFLQGRGPDVIRQLKGKMEEAAENLYFEEAARCRDRIHAIEKTLEKQVIVSTRFLDQDVIGLYTEEAGQEVSVLFIRNGVMIGGRTFNFKNSSSLPGEILSSFLKQFYGESRFIPHKILISHPIEDQDILGEWLSELKGRNVQIVVPKKGDKYRLVRMAIENAEGGFKARISTQGKEFLEKIKDKLLLNYLPRHIDCFDISNIHGTLAVGSMVVFKDGEPINSKYRRFRVRTVGAPDDYSMMEEVIKRQYSNIQNEDIPDLVVVDGGKGQLNIAVSLLKVLRLPRMPDVASLAKEEKGSEKIYRPGRKNPMILSKNSPVLHLFQRVRDEAHRFAISYHKRLRKKATLKSVLDDIPGVGKKRKRSLLRRFGSIEGIKNASVQQLAEALQNNRKVAEQVYNYFRI